MLPGAEAERLASRALLLEEFLAGEAAAGRIPARIAERHGKVLLHGHCHQKAFGAMDAVQRRAGAGRGAQRARRWNPSCCGMAGAFGYAAETYEVSLAMGELSLLPAVRQAPPEAVIAADGFSCRHQIADGTGRRALHVAQILCEAMRDAGRTRRDRRRGAVDLGHDGRSRMDECPCTGRYCRTVDAPALLRVSGKLCRQAKTKTCN